MKIKRTEICACSHDRMQHSRGLTTLPCTTYGCNCADFQLAEVIEIGYGTFEELKKFGFEADGLPYIDGMIHDGKQYHRISKEHLEEIKKNIDKRIKDAQMYVPNIPKDPYKTLEYTMFIAGDCVTVLPIDFLDVEMKKQLMKLSIEKNLSINAKARITYVGKEGK